MYTAKVIAHARRVPWGMATLGFLRSPEILAPAAERDRGERGGRERGRERDGVRNITNSNTLPMMPVQPLNMMAKMASNVSIPSSG